MLNLAPKPAEPLNAAEALQEFLAADLRAVNEEIIARMHSEVALIPQLAAHIIAAGGKRLRPLLTLAAAQLCGYKGKAHIGLAASVEFIHTATLLHDDVVDESRKRRGMDTANEVFGNKASVLVGDFLFSRSFQLMVGAGRIDVLRVLSDAAATIAEGEVHQLLTANNLATTRDEYYRVIGAKTAALFAAASEIGAMISDTAPERQKALRDYGWHLGLAFQLSDDVLDYSGLPGKQPGDDFRDGKVTLPLILAYADANNDDREFWQRTIERQENVTDADFTRALSILKRGALDHAMQQAERHAQSAQDALAPFPASPLKNLLLRAADFAARR